MHLNDDLEQQSHMGRREKMFAQVLRGTSDGNISFEAMRHLLKSLGFSERIRGSHHIFAKTGIIEILNLQSDGNSCKPYQVKQVRGVILNNKMGGKTDD